jgi:hypothetical protein
LIQSFVAEVNRVKASDREDKFLDVAFGPVCFYLWRDPALLEKRSPSLKTMIEEGLAGSLCEPLP